MILDPRAIAEVRKTLRHAEDALATFDALVGAAEELAASVEHKLPTMNFYFGPGARMAVSQGSIKEYRRIVAAVMAVRSALPKGDT